MLRNQRRGFRGNSVYLKPRWRGKNSPPSKLIHRQSLLESRFLPTPVIGFSLRHLAINLSFPFCLHFDPTFAGNFPDDITLLSSLPRARRIAQSFFPPSSRRGTFIAKRTALHWTSHSNFQHAAYDHDICLMAGWDYCTCEPTGVAISLQSQ